MLLFPLEMVRILSTGEIVKDDEPRAQQGNARPRQVLNRIQYLIRL